MLRIFIAALALLAGVEQAWSLSQSAIPTKVPTTWGSSAPGGNITCPMPAPSQIGITNGRASWTDGFPPLTFLSPGAGGVPPFGQDFNGVLCQLSQWVRWQNAGALIPYDAGFSSAIGGYPKGAILLQASAGYCFWISQVDNNTSDPDTGGANWTGSCPGGGVSSLSPSTGSANAQVVTVTPFNGQTGVPVCFIPGFANTGPLQINVNGAGLQNVVSKTLAGLSALVGGEVQPSAWTCAILNGAPEWELLTNYSLASLVRPNQPLSGGAIVVTFPIGTLASTTYQVNCGNGPLQDFTNNGVITISAPANDGSCMLYDLNAGSAGAITFSGFTVNSNTGEPLTTTNGNKFFITIARIGGVSTYLIKALQ